MINRVTYAVLWTANAVMWRVLLPALWIAALWVHGGVA